MRLFVSSQVSKQHAREQSHGRPSSTDEVYDLKRKIYSQMTSGKARGQVKAKQEKSTKRKQKKMAMVNREFASKSGKAANFMTTGEDEDSADSDGSSSNTADSDEDPPLLQKKTRNSKKTLASVVAGAFDNTSRVQLQMAKLEAKARREQASVDAMWMMKKMRFEFHSKERLAASAHKRRKVEMDLKIQLAMAQQGKLDNYDGIVVSSDSDPIDDVDEDIDVIEDDDIDQDDE